MSRPFRIHNPPVEPGAIAPTVMHTNFEQRWVEKERAPSELWMPVEKELKTFRVITPGKVVQSRDDETTYVVMRDGSLRSHARFFRDGKRVRISKKQRIRMRNGGKYHFTNK